MSARCEIDLSPGARISPRSGPDGARAESGTGFALSVLLTWIPLSAANARAPLAHARGARERAAPRN
jgi:hypothetical protein